MHESERRYISVPEAGRLLGLGRSQAYAHAAAGRLPVVRLGRKLLVSTRALAALEEEAARLALAAQERAREDSGHAQR